MPSSRKPARQRGEIEELPSGSLRVKVYAGIDPVTKKRHYLREVVPAGPKAKKQAQALLTRLLNQVDERRQPRTNATVNQLLDKHFELAGLDPTTLSTYVGYATNHIRPLIGRVQVGALDANVFDSFYLELRRCRVHCDRRPRTDHRTTREHDCDERCRPHRCSPLGASTIRQIHFILSGALKRAVRWRWIGTSPIAQAEPPPAPRPDPRPPTAAEAARLLNEAWAADPDWGTLVWLAMVTGARRGELCALRWEHVDLDAAVMTIRRSIWQRSSEMGEKDTKTHQQRRVALDAETVAVLTEHRQRWEARAEAVRSPLRPRAFVFSLAHDASTHLRPDAVSQRYAKLAARLGITTSFHKLRHYSAWVSESDQRAAKTLTGRLPVRSGDRAPRHPYEHLAITLADELAAGRYRVGAFLPGQKALARERGVSVGTAHRAVSLLVDRGLVEVVAGHGFRVVAPILSPAAEDVATAPAVELASTSAARGSNRLGELQQLADLYRAEILTRDEFEQEKVRILGG